MLHSATAHSTQQSGMHAYKSGPLPENPGAFCYVMLPSFRRIVAKSNWLARRTVSVNHRLVISTVGRKPNRRTDRRRQVLKQTMEAFRRSADVMRRQLTRNCPESKLSRFLIPLEEYRCVHWPLAPAPPPPTARPSPQLAAPHDTSTFQPRLGRRRRPPPQAATDGRSVRV